MTTTHSYCLDLSSFGEYAERFAVRDQQVWSATPFLEADFDDFSSSPSHSLVEYAEESSLSPSEFSEEPSSPSSESERSEPDVAPTQMILLPSAPSSRNSSGLAPSYTLECNLSADLGWQRNSSGLSNSLLDAATNGIESSAPTVTATTIISSDDARERATQTSISIYSIALKLDAENGKLVESTPGSHDFVFDLVNHAHRLELEHSFVKSLIEGASAGEENAPEVSSMDLRCLAEPTILDFENLTPFLFVRRREMRPENENYYSIRTRTSSMVTFVFVGSASSICALMHKKLELHNDISSFQSAARHLGEGSIDELLVNVSLRDATTSAKLKPHVNGDNEIDYSTKAYRLPHTNQYAVAFEFPMTAADTTMRNLNGQRELFVDAHFILPRPHGAQSKKSERSSRNPVTQCHPALPTHPELQYACADCFIKVDIQPGMVKRGGRDVKSLPSASHVRGPSALPTPMTAAPIVELEKKEVSTPKKKERVPRKRVTNPMVPVTLPTERRRAQRTSTRPLFDEEQESMQSVEYSLVEGETVKNYAVPYHPVSGFYTPMYTPYPAEMMVPLSMHSESMRSVFVFQNEWDASAYGYQARMYAPHQN